MVAIGVAPNNDLAKEAGIKLMDNGAILVDREGKTSIDSIYESMLVFPSLSTNIAPLSINLMPASFAKSLLGVTPIATTT